MDKGKLYQAKVIDVMYEQDIWKAITAEPLNNLTGNHALKINEGIPLYVFSRNG